MWQTSQDFRFNTRLMRVDVENQWTAIWEYGGVNQQGRFGLGPPFSLAMDEADAEFTAPYLRRGGPSPK